MAIVNGWIALILFITSFYLAIRLPFLNWIFDGLKYQLRLHHFIALMSLMFMSLHSAQVLWHFKDHLEMLFDWSDIGLLSGWITFVGIIIAMPFAFYRVQIPYRQWRLTHLITSLCLATAFIHTLLLFEPDNYKEWIIVVLVGLIGVIALFLAIILPACPFWGKKYLITSIIKIRPKLFLIQLQCDKKNEIAPHFKFDPGHFLYLKFIYRDFSCIWHPFTIISKPSDPYIELFIKARGKDTERLNTISLPVPLRILAPFGTSFWRLDQNQLWIAYGVGAAIFLAAIRSFPSSFHKKIHFICCDSSINKIFFNEELDDCMYHNSNFSWESYIGSGIQAIDELSKRSLDTKSIDKVRICGHPLFQKSLKAMLVSRGIRSQHIELEGLL